MRRRKIALWVILGYIIIAIMHPFIANDKPIICKVDGNYYFPVLSGKDQIEGVLDFALNPPIPYSYKSIHTEASFSAPLTKGHLLGTDILGRDTLAGLLKGTEIAVKIGLLSILFASILALLIGLFSSYSRRFPIKLGIGQFVLLVLSACILIYYSWMASYGKLSYLPVAIGVLVLVNIATWKLLPTPRKKIELPIDNLYLRFVEAMKSIPTLILLLALISIFERFTVTGLIILLAILMSPTLSRYIRAESLKILSQEYITAAKAYGASNLRILTIHLLPKLLTSLSVVLAFSISSAIIVESTLSFLGLGVPIDVVSWGSMLREARGNISAWWLAVFPGIALFGLILSLNILGEKEP